MPPEVLFGYLDKAGVRFVNYFGIGQSLDMASSCTYYLDCPGTSALPSIKNDFVNGVEVKAYPHENLHIVLSMTFIDLQNPEGVVDTIRLYDKEYPGMFKWAGELNVVKQALMNNGHEAATMQDIDNWAPFMKIATPPAFASMRSQSGPIRSGLRMPARDPRQNQRYR